MFMGLFMLPRKLACFFDRAGWALAMALMAGWVGCGRAPERVGDPVTFDTVLATLTNRVRMALPPQGTMRMVSSYDRTGGNNDWLQGLTPDADGFVTLAELEGPGCIVRIWMTGYRYKELRFYVDGESEPRIQRSPRDFFGGEAPFSSPLNGVVSGGSYGYVPIPYEKSLVIKGLWPDIGPENRPYLQVNYFSYPKGTRVESYPRELSPQQMTHVEAVRRAWEMSTDSVEADMLEALKSAEPVLLKPGSTIEWLSESGEGMLDGFAIALDFAPGTDAVARQQALRSTALHLYWDGQADPGVAVPLGDFFGNALAWRAWRSLFAGQTNGVFFSRWPMPYANGARGTLRNDGPFPVAIRTAHVAAVRPEGARYFHAAWHHAVGEGSPYPILHTAHHSFFAIHLLPLHQRRIVSSRRRTLAVYSRDRFGGLFQWSLVLYRRIRPARSRFAGKGGHAYTAISMAPIRPCAVFRATFHAGRVWTWQRRARLPVERCVLVLGSAGGPCPVSGGFAS